jgi:hypothetical protein
LSLEVNCLFLLLFLLILVKILKKENTFHYFLGFFHY